MHELGQPHPMTRYQALADDIEASIRTGVLRPGDRLPSVRRTCEARGVSASTVFQAYYLLEARGLVRARERSGYYVSAGAGQRPASVLRPMQPQETSIAVDVSEYVFEVLQASMTPGVVAFGAAFPSPRLFPLARLGQSLAASAQALGRWSSVDDFTPGNPALRRQIALRYLADGLQVPAEEIIVTNGALEALNLCLAAVTRPGDRVVVESPTFYGALQALARRGLQAVEIPTEAREGVDLAALEHAIVRHRPAACWLMTSFQNPLGSLMPDAKKQALVGLLAHYGVPLIEDDVYAELYFGDKRPLPAKAFDRTGSVLHCGSFSKCLAPGYRLGWAAPGRFAKAVARHKLTSTLGSSAPMQLALADYLQQGGFDKHLRRLRQTLASRQARCVQAVTAFFPPGTRMTQPLGGYFVWVELPPGVDVLQLHRQALEHGISIAPGPIFSASGGFAQGMRLNYGQEWTEHTETALATLGQLAHRLLPQVESGL